MRSRTRTAPLVLALGTTAAVVTGLTSPVPASAAPPTAPYVSEIHYDNTGTDVDEFVEVTLPPGTSSAGLSIVLYNGNPATAAASYGSLTLPAATAPPGEPAVVVAGGPSSGIQNGAPDGLALVRDGQVLELLSYEGVLTASNGPAAGRTSTDIGVSEAGTEPVGESLQRFYDAGSDELVWEGPSPASKGQVNRPAPTGPPATTCDTTVTNTVGEVQGSDFASPLVGDTVTIEAVVVGDVPGLGGFHLQDDALDADGDPATSDGVLVQSTAPVDLGDTVRVTGVVEEEFGQTQLAAGDDGVVCSEGSQTDLPTAATLDLPAGAAAREPLEGMLVAPADTLSVSEVFDLTRFGELTLSADGILVQPTELARPGTPEAEAIAADNTLRRITLDDASNDSVTPATAPYLTATTPVRVGDDVTFSEPLVLGYGFGQWRLQPADGTADGVLAPQNTREVSPDPVGGDVQVGAFNVLNYFLTWSGPDARGARSASQFEKQADKIVPAINALGADVVTLMEIEDTDSSGFDPGNADAALADLVARLNADAGAGTWAYVPLPEELYAVDRDVIRNAIIFKPASVRTVGEPVGLVDESVWFNAREPVAQTFTGRAPAEDDVFTVVANHLKSKSPGTPAPTGNDNEDVGDGQGAWNGDRTRQAASLATFTEGVRAETEDEDVLLLGDFNAYTQEDPIERLRDAGFEDLGDLLDPGRYSYVFDDQSGSLDHALSTAALTEKVTDLAHWNINAVESFAYQYTGAPALYAPDPFRSSDHDPLVLGLDLEAPAAADYPCDGREPTVLGTHGDDVLRGTADPDVIHALSGDDTVSGLNADDVVCGGAGDDVLEGDNGADRLFGGAGDDVLRGGNGTDVLDGGSGRNTLVQGRG